jgi:excisionase family DNA binding protein
MDAYHGGNAYANVTRAALGVEARRGLTRRGGCNANWHSPAFCGASGIGLATGWRGAAARDHGAALRCAAVQGPADARDCLLPPARGPGSQTAGCPRRERRPAGPKPEQADRHASDLGCARGAVGMALLWSLTEAAHQLGDVSTRTVRRMIERGDLPVVRVGRTVKVPAFDVRKWVEMNMSVTHNQTRVGSGMQYTEIPVCHTNAKTVRSGGRRSPTDWANELDNLLEQRTARKRRHLKQSGSSKRSRRKPGVSNPITRSKS